MRYSKLEKIINTSKKRLGIFCCVLSISIVGVFYSFWILSNKLLMSDILLNNPINISFKAIVFFLLLSFPFLYLYLVLKLIKEYSNILKINQNYSDKIIFLTKEFEEFESLKRKILSTKKLNNEDLFLMKIIKESLSKSGENSL